MNSKQKKQALGLAVLVGVLGVVLYWPHRAVLKVGSYSLSAKQVKYRDQVIYVNYPEEKRSLGKEQLKKAYLYAEILKRNGRAITDEDLKKEAERIDKNTRMPEMLQRIKDIYKGDLKNYYATYILPVLVETKLRSELFAEIQKNDTESSEQAKAFLEQVSRVNVGFELFAKEKNITLAYLRLSKARGLEWFPNIESMNESSRDPSRPEGEDPNARNPTQMRIQRELEQRGWERTQRELDLWMRNVVPNLDSKGIYGQVIPQAEAWIVVKSIKADAQRGQWIFAVANFPKPQFEGWFQSQAQNVVIKE